MYPAVLCFAVALAANTDSLAPGNHTRTLQVDGRERSYLVHVPPSYDSTQHTPVVLVLHGAWTNGPITAIYSGLDHTADDNNFISVYPNGTGLHDTALFWNSGGRDRKAPLGRTPPDDVKFIGMVLDDLASVLNVDSSRIYATGISNGGMMCYRLAAEMRTALRPSRRYLARSARTKCKSNGPCLCSISTAPTTNWSFTMAAVALPKNCCATSRSMIRCAFGPSLTVARVSRARKICHRKQTTALA